MLEKPEEQVTRNLCTHVGEPLSFRISYELTNGGRERAMLYGGAAVILHSQSRYWQHVRFPDQSRRTYGIAEFSNISGTRN